MSLLPWDGAEFGSFLAKVLQGLKNRVMKKGHNREAIGIKQMKE